MIYRAYRFASAAAALVALAAAAPLAMDEIGIASAPPELDATGEVVTPGAALPGWHVNAAWHDAEPEAWADARIAPAEAPRWWSGVPRDEPTPPAPPVPLAVTNFQARAVMRGVITGDGRSLETVVNEMLRDAKAAAAALPEAHADRLAADRAWLAWEQSNEFTRDGDLVRTMSAQIGLSAAEVDDLFRAAAGVVA